MGISGLLTSLSNDALSSAANLTLSPWLSFTMATFFSLNSVSALLIMTITPVFLIIAIYATCINNVNTIYQYIYDLKKPNAKIYNVSEALFSQSIFVPCISPFAIIALNGISRYAIQVLYFYDTSTMTINQYVADTIVSLDWLLNPRFLFIALLLMTLYIALITIQKITYFVNQFVMYTMILSVAPLLRMSIDVYNIQNDASNEFTQSDVVDRLVSGQSASNIEAILHTLCPSQDTAIYAAMDDLQESILQIAQKVVGGLKNPTLNVDNLKDALSQDSSIKENLSKKLAQLDIARLRYSKISLYSDAIADEIQIVRSAIR